MPGSAAGRGECQAQDEGRSSALKSTLKVPWGWPRNWGRKPNRTTRPCRRASPPARFLRDLGVAEQPARVEHVLLGEAAARRAASAGRWVAGTAAPRPPRCARLLGEGGSVLDEAHAFLRHAPGQRLCRVVGHAQQPARRVVVLARHTLEHVAHAEAEEVDGKIGRGVERHERAALADELLSRAARPLQAEPPVYSGGTLPGAFPSSSDLADASGRTMTSSASRSEPLRTSASARPGTDTRTAPAPTASSPRRCWRPTACRGRCAAPSAGSTRRRRSTATTERPRSRRHGPHGRRLTPFKEERAGGEVAPPRVEGGGGAPHLAPAFQARLARRKASLAREEAR